MTDRRLPDKAIDLMDEAAAKLRVALYSLPPELKAMKAELDRLQAEEEQAGLERDYERAAQKKAERLRCETEFTRAARQAGRRNTSSTRWWMKTTSPRSWRSGRAFRSTRCWRPKPRSCCRWKTALHERIVGQDEAVARHRRRHPPRALRA